MTKLVGTRVIQPVVPNDSADTYPTHYDEYGKGGYKTVDTLYERDNIPLDRQKLGMAVYVVATLTLYTLNSTSDTLSDGNWSTFSGGGGSGIIISPTEPASPATGQLWLDTNVDYVKVWTGSAWEEFVYRATMASDTGDLLLNGGYF